MARLPYVDPAVASEGVRALLEQLPAPLKIFRVMAQAESCFRPLIQLGTAILARQALSGRLRELAILHVARRSEAEYEWVQHVPIARAAGVGEAQVKALERGEREAPCFDEAERAVLAFTDELVSAARPSDGAFEALARHLPPREIVELVVAIGYYMMIARLMGTADIDLEPAPGNRMVEVLRR